ncbi:hypothetical protein BDY17DRAFT_302899 [Neohortaea acidophila]|uniref:Uncharacterized protein n=1 Tax=Neohortaea acidophila TaxID=245834 RepID=A0A6A6PJD3_9PEZI|nr:uncharacterized protein BDY17DRAFT_302899 [Neohortaea acidophila]KAF2479906.1 hypothetical protein BDY17DRAFT_302899 [Neohortaea acidophila]
MQSVRELGPVSIACPPPNRATRGGSMATKLSRQGSTFLRRFGYTNPDLQPRQPLRCTHAHPTGSRNKHGKLNFSASKKSRQFLTKGWSNGMCVDVSTIGHCLVRRPQRIEAMHFLMNRLSNAMRCAACLHVRTSPSTRHSTATPHPPTPLQQHRRPSLHRPRRPVHPPLHPS